MNKKAIGTLHKEGWIEYRLADRIYCLSCKKTFPDVMDTRLGQKVVSVGQFLHNQHSILFDKKIKHMGNVRTFQISCPFCNSINTVNGTEILEKRGHGGDRRSCSLSLYMAVKQALE